MRPPSLPLYGAIHSIKSGNGCVGETEDEAHELIREAIEFHIDSLREDGQPVPTPAVWIEYVDVQPAA